MRLGLQKRIVAYVVIGLTLLLGSFAYVAVQAVQRSTALVFDARLAIAESVASRMESNFRHASTVMVQGALQNKSGTTVPPAALQETVQDIYWRLSRPDSFPFFRVTGIALLDTAGNLVVAEPPDMEISGAMVPTQAPLPKAGGTTLDFFALAQADVKTGQFVSLWVPLSDARGDAGGSALLTTTARSVAEPFTPFGVSASSPGSAAQGTPTPAARTGYHLEVLTTGGQVILSIGPGEAAGEKSIHYSIVRHLLESQQEGVLVHNIQDAGTEDAGSHVVAIVPVPQSNVSVVLEQGADTALAVPLALGRQFLLLGILGLGAAVFVGWITTLQVVNPTKRLAAAAAQMAQGELSVPVQVRAQDEIADLAENLEIMRQQLQNALEAVEKTNRALEKRVQERTAQLQDMVRRIMSAQEEERQRIARELHDETAQVLTALTLTLDELARRDAQPRPGDGGRIQEARQIAADLLDGIRHLIYGLRPVALQDTGLAEALRWYAEEYVGRTGVATHVTQEGSAPRLPDHIELALYRIGQEALNNVARHAHARNVWVTIAGADERVRLAVRDDGVGFDPAVVEANSRTGGLGLAGMHERANLVGATLRVESEPGQGTTIRVEVTGAAEDA